MEENSEQQSQVINEDSVYTELTRWNAYTPECIFISITKNLLNAIILKLRYQGSEELERDVPFILRWHKWHAILVSSNSSEVNRTQESFYRIKRLFAFKLKESMPFASVTESEFDCIKSDAERINFFVNQIPYPVADNILTSYKQEELPCKVRNLWGGSEVNLYSDKSNFWGLLHLDENKK